MCHPDLLPYSLFVLVLKSAPAPFRIWPENPQYPWNAALLFWASPSHVQLAPKTEWAASREECVFWNLVVPVWERKSFQILFGFFFTLKERLLVLVNLKLLFSIEVKLLQVNTEWVERIFYWLAVLLWPHLPWALCHRKRPLICRGG